ncbi:hypothetical protein [Blastococcus sp. CCUG 61487]|uniref:hypothetical protein n=1 Tax=Blastococcus sp. CCUG 61487 TaxID=1840703 RepID=UPI0010C11104|nr:hypothetical protein [Blastococcus sp. CCUG 61487]TKJ22878.1 hypothetical protein A6V29_06155 [Blastococcus sp. CCUG 61487]
MLLSAALLLTGCGGDDSPLEGKTGPEVAELAADALEEAGSVRMAGTMLEDGEEMEVDLQLQGDDAAGTITVDGTEIELISVDGDVYMLASPDLLASFGLPEDIAAQFEGQWILLPAEDASDFADFSLKGFADELRNPDEGDIKEKTRKDELDGESVVVVEQEDGSTLTVKDGDPAYPLQITGGGESEGTVTFSDHGKKMDISAPDDVLDLEELMGS